MNPSFSFKDCINLKIPYIYVEKPALVVEDYLVNTNENNGIKFLQNWLSI